MDRIYSRRRIRIPKLNMFYSNNRKPSKMSILLILAVIATITFFMSINAINPIFTELSSMKARNLATEIINYETNRILAKHNYTNIVTTVGEGEDTTNVLVTDIVAVNRIANEIALAVEERLSSLRNETIEIPIGALTGNRYLSGMGPGVKVRVITRGNMRTQLMSEFEARGINQTIHRIYLNLAR
ncbi:MAG: hypothetical protein FWC68_05265 [Oscillospiraceae bacterium]|nr:hypothetical protein [Oscillospiraceae bacterium]